MSAISNDFSKLNSGKLNTTINPDVLGAFKYKCKQQGVQMNTIIEAFMRQFIQGGFYLKFGRDTDIVDVELDKSEYQSTGISNAPKIALPKGSVKDNFGETE